MAACNVSTVPFHTLLSRRCSLWVLSQHYLAVQRTTLSYRFSFEYSSHSLACCFLLPVVCEFGSGSSLPCQRSQRPLVELAA
ncbi:unnamed protein product [Vitrella brassicaformis CCMP3155]|uniref:Uncharacterized protein n=1 Tax=Vitrella brassicaformis (strain CCMP3155) TaxID=1169540 RepID=A0A0G4GP32_VITBC|nr:unnamed protein product [Vitrella brassicaformis CCMP3155]|eukprot:CEM32036.1 unnamed protein product [Vitrella brassicaformis CCMP3155]